MRWTWPLSLCHHGRREGDEAPGRGDWVGGVGGGWELGERGPRSGGHRSSPLLFTPAENGCLH